MLTVAPASSEIEEEEEKDNFDASESQSPCQVVSSFSLLPPPPALVCAAALGGSALAPPPAPACAIGDDTEHSHADCIFYVDSLTDTEALRPSATLERIHSCIQEDDESDDCGRLLGDIYSEREVKGYSILDDDIDGASEIDNDERGNHGLPEMAVPDFSVAWASANVIQHSRPSEDDVVDNASHFILEGEHCDAQYEKCCSHDVVEVSSRKTNELQTVTREEKANPSSNPRAQGCSERGQFIAPGSTAFVVKVPPPFPGLQYRSEKLLSQRLPRYAKDGCIVHGFLEDDGAWLRVGSGHYLPTDVNGRVVLETIVSTPELQGSCMADSAIQQGWKAKRCMEDIVASEDAGAECDDAVPDEGPRDVPRASFHGMLPSTVLSTSNLGATSPRRRLPSLCSPPKGSAAGLPPRYSVAEAPMTKYDNIEIEPNRSESVEQATRSLSPPKANPCPELFAEVPPDAHDEAAIALRLLMRPLDPFGDPDLERPHQLSRVNKV